MSGNLTEALNLLLWNRSLPLRHRLCQGEETLHNNYVTSVFLVAQANDESSRI